MAFWQVLKTDSLTVARKLVAWDSKIQKENGRKKRIFHSLLSSEFAANWGWPLVVDKLSLDSTIVAQVWQKKIQKGIPLGTHFSRQKKK